MPEIVFRDLGGGTDVPQDAFAGATAEGVMRILKRRQPEGTDTTNMSWRELAANVQPPTLTPEAIELLERVGPELLAALGDKAVRL